MRLRYIDITVKMATGCSNLSVCCLLCGATLSNSKLRRNVFTEEATEIKDALVEFLERNHGTDLVKRYLNTSKVVVLFPTSTTFKNRETPERHSLTNWIKV